MPITTTVVADTPQYTDYRETDPASGYVGERRVWKPGTVEANREATLTKAQQALATNATYLAITTPSAAQNTAQAKALTRQVNALIKLLLNDLADVNGT